jgi:cold shock CspA family protein
MNRKTLLNNMARGREAQMADLIKGSVAMLKREGGFGFIVGLDGRQYFFHRSAVADFDELTIGTVVRFRPTEGQKGPRAENIVRV